MKKKPIIILTEQELRSLITLNLEVIEKVEFGFAQLAAGKATVPPIMMIPVSEKNGEVDIKSAYIKGMPSMAIKIASGFFQNPDSGLPSQSGQMLVLSADTGFLEAVLLDNGYLTQIRTAAAGAIAAKYLAPDGVETVGVFGCGVQARYQMEALMLVKPFKKILMYSIDTEQRKQDFVQDIKKRLDVEVECVSSGAEMVSRCNIVVTTTPSRKGYFEAEWIHPGLHITSMGSDAEDKKELKGEVFSKANIIVCDLKTQSFRLGELRGAKEDGFLSDDTTVQEIGQIIAEGKSARTDNHQVSICDLTGVGVQDTMIALFALETARNQNKGTLIS